MYKIKRGTSKNVIGLTLTGKLTSEAYSQIVPFLEERIHEYGKIRILIELDRWDGWETLASFKDMVFVFKNSSKIERIAFILDSKTDRQSILFGQPFGTWSRSNTQYFSLNEKEEAWEWVSEGITGFKLEEEEQEEVEPKIRYGKKMEVLVVGGGLSGLTMGAILQDRGFEPTVVEASPVYRDQGTLTIWPMAGGVLKSLGVFERCLKAGQLLERIKIKDSEGELLKDYNLKGVGDEFGAILRIPHAQLREVLASQLKPEHLKEGILAETVKETKRGVKVRFSDGRTGSYDVVVCCDGVHSKMREMLFNTPKPQKSGLVGWRFWVKRDFKISNDITEYWAKDSFIKLFPYEEKVYVFAAANGDCDRARSLEFFEGAFSQYKGHVPQVIKGARENPSIWHESLYTLEVDECVQERVVLLGGAEMSFLPMSGLATSLNLESAYVLADELIRGDSKTVAKALEAYGKRRQRRTLEIQNLVSEHGLGLFVHAEALAKAKNFTKHFMGKEGFVDFWREALEGTI